MMTGQYNKYEITGELTDLRVTFFDKSNTTQPNGRLSDLAKQVAIHVTEKIPDDNLGIKIEAIREGAYREHEAETPNPA